MQFDTLEYGESSYLVLIPNFILTQISHFVFVFLEFQRELLDEEDGQQDISATTVTDGKIIWFLLYFVDALLQDIVYFFSDNSDKSSNEKSENGKDLFNVSKKVVTYFLTIYFFQK